MNKLIIASLVALAACGGKAPEPETPAEPTVSADVTLALKIATGLEADPASADSVLTANGLTRMGFDSLLFRIAEDPTLSAQYTAGRR